MNATLLMSFMSCALTSQFIMKLISIKLAPASKRKDYLRFLLSPVFSIQAWHKCPNFDSRILPKLMTKSLCYLIPLVASYIVFHKFISALPIPHFAIAYFAIFPLVLLGETAGPLAQVLYSLLGKLVPEHHRTPLASKSISDFWGVRWNTWLSDWFRDSILKPLRKTPAIAVLTVFVFSGVWHELILNIPAKLLFGFNYIGSMLLYFLVQWAGLMIEKQYLRKIGPFGKRLFAWLIIVGPVPLILNEPTLRTVWLWPFK
jgi:hypothetical protein